MFLKKSLLFTTALALLLFAGQASAQGVSLSLSHVPGDDGTENMVSGPAGTTFTVRVSQTGVNGNPLLANAGGLEIYFGFDPNSLSLTGASGLPKEDTETGATLTVVLVPGLSVPDAVDLTFTTVADVTDTEFSIDITDVGVGASLMVLIN